LPFATTDPEFQEAPDPQPLAHHYQHQTENPKTATQSPTATLQDANNLNLAKHNPEDIAVSIAVRPYPEGKEKAP